MYQCHHQFTILGSQYHHDSNCASSKYDYRITSYHPYTKMGAININGLVAFDISSLSVNHC